MRPRVRQQGPRLLHEAGARVGQVLEALPVVDHAIEAVTLQRVTHRPECRLHLLERHYEVLHGHL